MKAKLIAAAAVLSAAVLSFTAPPVLAGRGGGHSGGGFSGGYGGGNRGSSGGFHNYSGSAPVYRGGMRGGYTGGAFGRIYSGHPQSSSPPQGRIYRSPAISRVGTSGRQSSSVRSYGQHVNRGQSTMNRTNQVATNNRVQNTYGNRAVQRSIRTGLVSKQNLTTRDGTIHQANWARNNPKNQSRFDQRTQDKLRNWQGQKSSWAEANQRHHGDLDGHHHHGHDWWNHHCGAIILVDWGWWGWWDGWWYPAWGYDPYYSYYAYDGPVYGYGGLAPDEAVANVQSELQNLGYYYGTIDGILGPETQHALTRFQRDRGLPVTGAIDPDTVGSLGLG